MYIQNDAATATEIVSDDRTVWINLGGGNIGRFSWVGIDVHRPVDEQMDGAPECLACSHGETHFAEWRRFQTLMQEHHQVLVSDEHMPAFIRAEIDLTAA